MTGNNDHNCYFISFVNDAVSTATGTRKRAGQETINERGIIIMIITVIYIIC